MGEPKKTPLDRFPNRQAAITYLRVSKGFSGAEALKYLKNNVPKEPFYQDKIKKRILELVPDAFVWKEAAGSFSRSGIPDLSAVIHGKYYGFEVKRPYFGKISPLQQLSAEKIRAAGGKAYFVKFPEEIDEILKMNGEI